MRVSEIRKTALLLLLVPSGAVAQSQSPARRIIDVHLHAYSGGDFRTSPNPVTGVPSPPKSEEHMRETLAAMERYNIVLGIVSGPLEAVERWRTAAPERILASPSFGAPNDMDAGLPLTIERLRPLYRLGRLRALGEIGAQYAGLSPSDPLLEPYFALAEEFDVPVGIHTGSSFAGTPYACCPKFRLALGNPLLLEDLLVRHPKLRVNMMHAGLPWGRETIAVMKMYQQVYADLGAISWVMGRSASRFHNHLRDLVEAGLAKRIMFGSDQMEWPDAIGVAIESIESAGFLTEAQKQDIFYNNAARFLRLHEGATSAGISP